MKTKKITLLGVFTALALIIYIVESFLPPLAPIPGIKLGLSNVVTLVLLLNYSKKETFLVLLARILLSGIFTGQALYVLYSLAGGILCFLAMAAVSSFLKGHYIFLTSIVGSCFHNLGQILIALAVTKVWGLWAYFPILVISGVLTGLFTGLCAHFSQKYIMPHVS